MRRISEPEKQALVRLQLKRERKQVRRFRPITAPAPSASDPRTGRRVVAAPLELRFGDQWPQALRFLDRVRRAAMETSKGVFIDLRRCRFLSPVVGLMLCAEIERCAALRPGSVNGCDPDDPTARSVLELMGFHKHLKIRRSTPSSAPHDHILEIRSGGPSSDVPRDLEEVAAVAFRAFKDQAFANRVHGALNEALLNVGMHAYDQEFFVPGSAIAGRWWVVGLIDPKDHTAYFIAYDHGVGIATTAPKTSGEELLSSLDHIMAAIGLRRSDARDHDIIRATVNMRRSRTGKAQHGKGLTSMMRLVDLAGTGTVWIASGGGQYLYTREGNKEPVEGSEALRYRVPGTLILWRLRLAQVPEVA